MTAKRQLWDAIDEGRSRLVELCSRVIQVPSPNPPGDTRSIAEFVTNHLTDLGIAVDRHEPRAGSPNLVASLGSSGGRHLVTNAHLDTFPVARGEWAFPPFGGVVDGGHVHGCGATDMRAGLAVSLLLATLLTELDIVPAGMLTLSFSSDEETGGVWGTEWLLENVRDVRADACLIGDQNGRSVAIGEKGFCWLQLKLSGMSRHAAYSDGNSATRDLGVLLEIVHGLEELNSETAALEDRVTVNVGRVEGGTSPNLVAEQALAEVDIRIPMGFSVEDIQGQLLARILSHGLECDVRMLRCADPSLTPASDRIVSVAAGAHEAVYDAVPDRTIRIGASDARLFRKAGIPTVVYGPTPHNMGAPNEYVEIDELIAVAKVHAAIVVDFFEDN